MTATRVEQRIFRDLLAEDMTLEEAQEAFSDINAWKCKTEGMSYKGRPNRNSWRWQNVNTPRMTVCFCWYRHRNTNGYFVGWRQTVSTKGEVKTDQYVARKSKKALAALLKRTTEALLAKYPPEQKIKVKRPDPELDDRIHYIDGSPGDWMVYLKDGFRDGPYGVHGFHLEDKRSLRKRMRDVQTCYCDDCVPE